MGRRRLLLVVGLATLFGLLASGPRPAAADDHVTFRGCAVDQGADTLTLATSGDERVEIVTTWLRPEDLASALVDCVTVRTVRVDGRYVAESIQAGDEPNEVRSVTAETTRDREKRERGNHDNRGDKKQR